MYWGHGTMPPLMAWSVGHSATNAKRTMLVTSPKRMRQLRSRMGSAAIKAHKLNTPSSAIAQNESALAATAAPPAHTAPNQNAERRGLYKRPAIASTKATPENE